MIGCDWGLGFRGWGCGFQGLEFLGFTNDLSQFGVRDLSFRTCYDFGMFVSAWSYIEIYIYIYIYVYIYICCIN